MAKNNLKITFIPDPVTMRSIKYDWLGRVKEIEFRSLEEIKQICPEYLKRLATKGMMPALVRVG